MTATEFLFMAFTILKKDYTQENRKISLSVNAILTLFLTERIGCIFFLDPPVFIRLCAHIELQFRSL